MLPAAIIDRALLDPLPLGQDGFCPSVVNVHQGQIVQTFKISCVFAGLGEGVDLALEFAGQMGVVEQDPALERLAPAASLITASRRMMLSVAPMCLPVGKVTGECAFPYLAAAMIWMPTFVNAAEQPDPTLQPKQGRSVSSFLIALVSTPASSLSTGLS
ncbi:hypothetical protein [Oryzibacter oryziterrae]|uniref:hypothetical protein n=1 Tax=Oryzibacter oryziterrae TaxID=2766474 RepID=UPI001F434CEC|nr:hypothetical protein [Oryzibacter oryziterrae]